MTRGLTRASSVSSQEVLDGVGDVDLGARDAHLGESLVEHPPGRPDERLSRQVLLITRLLADEERRGAPRTLPQDGLRPGLVQLAAPALLGGHPEGGERRLRGDEFESGGVFHHGVLLSGDREPRRSSGVSGIVP